MAQDFADSVAGCLLGTAVGDAIGLSCEGLTRRRQQRLFPDLERYHLLFGRGMVSDDTEHTCMVAQALIASAGEPRAFARSLAWRLRFWLLSVPAGIGYATLRAICRLWLYEEAHAEMDALEQAHLALIRGDIDQARQLVEAVLEKEPDNLTAMKLFNQVRSQQARIKAEQIEEESRVQARTNWLNTFDPSTVQVYLMLIGASILVGVGFCLAINPFILGIRHGFSYQVVKPTFLGDGHYPVHFLLVGPVIMFGLGAFLLYSLFRYLWWD